MTIKKGDLVQIISGPDKGKKGTVEKTIPSIDRVIVAGINIRKHHLKPRNNRPKGGIVEAPAPLNRSNVMIICPSCSKLTRIQHTSSNGVKYRSCTHCKNSIDNK